MQRSWAAQDWAEEDGISIWEAECQIDIGLFLDKYPRWELGTSHTAIILHKMFLHTMDWGQKEAEWMVCWGCCSSMYDPKSEADQSAMELVGYHTSQKEMRDIYQSIYLLQRAPSLSPCGAQARSKAIQDTFSSLKGWLHRYGCSATIRNLEPQEEQARLNCWGSYEEALRAACQRALDTIEALESDLKRLSQWRRDRSWSHSRNHSQSRSHSRTRNHSRNCSWSESHSRTRSQSRSHSRA